MTRWLLWNLRCLRGRRCARLEVLNVESPVTGAVFVMDYACGGCGTIYRSEALAGEGGFTELPRVRVG